MRCQKKCCTLSSVWNITQQEVPLLVLEQVQGLGGLHALQIERVVAERAQIPDLQRVGVDVETIAVDVARQLLAQLGGVRRSRSTPLGVMIPETTKPSSASGG